MGLTFGVVVASAQAQQSLRLDLPLDCSPGIDCWVVNHVDLDSSTGKQDFMCRNHTYDGHKGTDFAIRDLRRMTEGVPVRASAAGIVAGMRDGMIDNGVAPLDRNAIGGRECGNGVVIRHGDGWETQYCHLRRGSIMVKSGDAVVQGAQLGLVGQSGLAEFPHVHISVRQDGKIIDPFTGGSPEVGGIRCDVAVTDDGMRSGLWWNDAFNETFYEQTSIYNAGFSGVAPNIDAIRAGLYANSQIPPTAPVLAFWADMFWVEKDDLISLRLMGPDGGIMVENTAIPEKHQARQYMFVGKKLRQARWPAGTYVGEITVSRRTESGERQSVNERRELTIP